MAPPAIQHVSAADLEKMEYLCNAQNSMFKRLLLWSACSLGATYVAHKIGISPILAAVSLNLVWLANYFIKTREMTYNFQNICFSRLPNGGGYLNLLLTALKFPFFRFENLSRKSLEWLNVNVIKSRIKPNKSNNREKTVQIDLKNLPSKEEQFAVLQTALSQYGDCSKIVVYGLNLLNAQAVNLLASFKLATTIVFKDCTFDDRNFLQWFPTFQNSTLVHFCFYKCPNISDRTYNFLNSNFYLVQIEKKENKSDFQKKLNRNLFVLSCERSVRILALQVRKLKTSNRAEELNEAIELSALIERLKSKEEQEKLYLGKSPQYFQQIQNALKKLQEPDEEREINGFIDFICKKRGVFNIIFTPCALQLANTFFSDNALLLLFTQLRQLSKTKLTEINLSGTQCTAGEAGKIFVALGSLPIRTLRLDSCPLSANSLRGLNAMRDTLRILDLSNTCLKRDNLLNLVNLRKLEELYLTRVNGFGIDSFTIFQALTEGKLRLLCLEGVPFNDQFLSELVQHAEQLVSKTSFILANTTIRGERRVTICKKRGIENSIIASLKHLSRAQKEQITHLSFAKNTKLCADDFLLAGKERLLDLLPNIEDLDISGCEYDAKFILHLSSFKNLKTLILNNFKVKITRDQDGRIKALKISSDSDGQERILFLELVEFVDLLCHDQELPELQLNIPSLSTGDIGIICFMCSKLRINTLDLSKVNFEEDDLNQQFKINGEQTSLLRELSKIKNIKINETVPRDVIRKLVP